MTELSKIMDDGATIVVSYAMIWPFVSSLNSIVYIAPRRFIIYIVNAMLFSICHV